jgi:hypothetical protein
VLAELEKKMEGQGMDESTLSQNAEAMAPMKANLANLKPVIAASQQNLLDLEGKEKIMSEMILKVNKHLMIEKIRMS